MRILDNTEAKPLEDITLYLTPAEAVQLRHSLDHLISNPAEHHVHLDDDSYKRELTVAIYTGENLMEFDEQSRKLITND
jgi:hypothetical protein